MTTYAKGSHPQDLDAACGGVVINKLVSRFSKDSDNDANPMGTGKFVAPRTPDESKTGSSQPHANRTGNKSLPAIKPRQ